MPESDRFKPRQRKEADVDLDKIVRDAVSAVQEPHSEISLRMRLVLVLAALVIAANTVISVFNSIALKDEISCNHQLTIALQEVGDQNRTNTKQIIDTLLSGKPITRNEAIAARERYDKTYKQNNGTRTNVLQTTCKDGGTTSLSPSGS